ncbi:MAG: hypothetical protein GY838_18250 [bacterium]|nr:hypothetical protein [bacterium]
MARQGSAATLDDRSRDILEAIVDLHIETGRPVSSGLVERAVGRRVSSATIRAVMKLLEEAGFLLQPHTSSGRVPTDAGFRSFVDGLQAGWEFRRHEAPPEMRRLLDDGLGPAAAPAGVPRLARLLSRLTDNISIILGPAWEATPVERVEVYPRGSGRALMVVILGGSRVETGMFELAADFPEAVVDEALARLNRRLRDLTVADVRGGALEKPDLVGNPATRCLAQLAAAARRVVDELEDGDVELEGVANVLDEPEFHEPEPLQALLRFVESPRLIRRTLDRLERPVRAGFGVWIGAENPVGELRRFALVTRRFGPGGRGGILAVLGPRRMFYQRAFHGIDLLGRAIDNHPERLAC